MYIGSIRVPVGSDPIRVISNFGSIRAIIISGRFGFGTVQFRISGRNRSTLSHVGSGLVSGCSVRVVQSGSLLPCLRAAALSQDQMGQGLDSLGFSSAYKASTTQA